MKKLFKFMANLVYPLLILMFIMVYENQTNSNLYGSEALYFILYMIIFPILTLTVVTGIIGTFAILIKEALAERKQEKADVNVDKTSE